MEKNVKKTIISRWLFAGAASLALLLVSACEIGLGKAVDTLPPQVSVTSPYSNSIIRGEFILSGECSDDKGIEKVTVSLKNTDLDETYETITVKPDGKKWEVKLNTYDEATKKYQFNDGKYDITVESYDTSNKTSGPRNLSVVLDNTPPLLVLTRPSASDTYGQKFDLSGQVADDNNIDLLEVYVYSCADDSLLNVIKLNNVPPTVDLTAAVYGDGIYEKLYKGDKYSGTQEFYCEFKVYDAARKFPAEEGDNGNVAEYFYSYKNISSIMNKYRLTEIHHMQNGLKEADAEVLEKLAIPFDEEGSIRSSTSKFTLNPLNNPKFSILGYAPVSKYDSLKNGNEYKIANRSQVTLKISSGLDNTLIENDTIGVKAYKVKAKGDNEWEPVREEDGSIKKITIFPALKEMFGGNLVTVLTDEDVIKARESAITEIGSYDRTVMLDITSDNGLEIGGTYIFEVTAYDQNSNNVYNEGDEYGFFLSSTGVAPNLSLTEPKEQTSYIKADGKVVIEGNTFHEEGIPQLIIQIDQYGTDYSKVLEYDETNGIGADGDFRFVLNPADFIPSTDLNKSEQYTFKITSIQGSFETSPIFKTVMYDITAPEINITSLTPVADSTIADAVNGKEYNINGEITIRGSFNDEDTAIDTDTMKYKYKKANGTWSEPIDVIKQQNFTVKIDTTELKDKADLDVVFMVKDKAGNLKEEIVYYEGETKYFVDQSTDYPIVALQDLKEKDSAGNTEPYKGFNTTTQSSKMTGQITDDDGLKKITVQCLTKESNYTSNFVSDSVSYPVTLINLTDPAEYKNARYQYNLSQDLPSMRGNYKLVFEVEDVNGKVTTWSCQVRISGNAPEISDITKDRTHLAVTANGVKEIEITGNISGEHTAANPLTLYAAKSLDENGVPENKVEVWKVTDPLYTSGDTISWTHTFSMTDADFPLNTKADGTSIGNENVKIYLQAEDSAGIGSTVKEFVFTADDILPVVDTLSSAKNAAGYITAASSPFSTTFTDASGVTEYFWQIKETAPEAVNSYADLTAANGWTMANAGTSNTFYGSFKEKGAAGNGLEEGSYSVYVIAVDKAQNVSLPKAEAFKVDLKAPVITINNTASEAKTTFALSGKVEDTYGFGTVAKVSVKESGQTDSVDISVSSVDGTWTSSAGAFPTSGADGIYTYTVSATDAAGNPATPVSYSVTIDKSAPTVEILSPASDTTWLNALDETKVSGRVSDGTGVGVDKVYYKLGATASKPAEGVDPESAGWTLLGSDSNWEVTVPTGSEGEAVNTIWVCATDKLGNICNPVKRQINVDTATPVIALKKVEDVSGTARTLTVNSGTYYSKGSFKITVEATDSNLDTVKCNNAATTDAGSNLYTFTASETKDYEFVVTDKAGKTKSVSVNVKVDGTKPVVSTLASSDKNANGYITSTPSPFNVAYTDNDGSEGVELYWQISASAPAAATYASKAAITTTGSGWTKVNGDTFYGNFKTKGSSGTGIEEGTGYKAYVVAVDRADNVSLLKELAFGVDLNAPVVTITNTVAEAKEQFVLSGTVTDTIGNGSVSKVTVSESGQTTAKEFAVTNGTWSSGSTKFPTANTDGTYTYTVSAVDAAGNAASVKTYTVKFDNTAPSVSISKPTDGEWITGNGSAAVTVNGTAMDGSGVGVDKVYYKDATTASKPADGINPVAEGWTLVGGAVDNWSFTVVPGGEGKAKKTIWIFAEDKLGNRSNAVSREINVDNVAPTVKNAKVYYVNGGTSTEISPIGGTYYVKGDFKITVEASDTNALKETSPVTCNGTAISGTSGTYTYNGTSTGNYEFKATDIAGKESAVLKVNVTVDPNAPVPEFTSVDKLLEYGGRTDVVNGTITIKGTSRDDDDKLVKTVLSLYRGSETTPVETWEYENNAAANFNKTYDTTGLKVSGGTAQYKGLVTLKLVSWDRAGNSNEPVVKTIYVDQDSDIPTVSFTNTNIDVNVKTIADVNKDKNGVNLFTVKEALKILAEDDDGIDSVTISIAPKDDPTNWSSATVQNGSYALPETEGFYWIKAEAADVNGKTKSVPAFLIAASDGEPTVNVNTKTISYVKGTSESTANPVSVSVTYAGGSSTRISRTVSGTGVTDKSATLNPTGKTFTDTIKAFCAVNNSAVVTVTYKVENDFGQTNEATYSYLIDNIAPVLKGNMQTYYYTDASGNEVYTDYASGKWHNEAKFKLKGTWTEAGYSSSTGDIRNGSGIEAIEYWITETEDHPADNAVNPTGSVILGTPSGNDFGFTQSISGFNEGTNYIHFRASDVAGNYSGWTSCNLNVDTTAPELKLDQTGSVFTNESGIGDFVISGTLKDAIPESATGAVKCSGTSTYQAIRVFVGEVPASGLYDNYQKTGTSIPSYVKKVNDKNVYIFKNEIAHSATVGSDGSFSLKIGEGTDILLPKDADGKYLSNYTITVIGEDVKEHRTKLTFTLGMDTKAPGIKINGPKSRRGTNSLGQDENPAGIYGTANDEIGGSGTKAIHYQVLDASAAAPVKGTGNWTTVETTGAWSDSVSSTATGVTEGGKLKEGTYKLYVYSEDNAGNKSEIVSEEFHVDYSAPSVKITLGSDVNTYNENTTLAQDVKTEAFSFAYEASDTYGLATDGNVLVVKKDSSVIPAASDGNYTEDGTYEFTVTAIDKAGKKTEVKKTVKLDTTGPTVTLTTPTVGADEWQSNTQIKVSGSVQDASNVSAVWYKAGNAVSMPVLPSGKTYKDDSVWSGWTKIVPAGSSWSYTVEDTSSSANPKPRINPTFADGTTILNFAAVDEHGNATEFLGNILNVDSDTPTLKITTDGTNEVSNVVKNSPITLEFIPTDNHLDSVTIEGTDIDGTQLITAVGGKYTFNVPAVEKKYEYTVTAKDKAGRPAVKTVSVIYDVTPPAINVSYVTTETKNAATKTAFPAEWTNSNKMTLIPSLTNARLSGIASAGYFVSLTSYTKEQLAALDDSIWNAMGLSGSEIAPKDIQLSDGSGQKVYVRVTDNAGNTDYKISEDSYKVDTTSPSGFITSPSTGSTIGKNQNVSVKVSAADQVSLSGLASVKVKVLYKKVEGGTEKDKSNEYTAVQSENEYVAEITSADLKEIGELKKADGTILNGTIKVEAVITDNAGNSSNTSQISVNYDNDAPEVTIVNPAKKLNGETEVATPLNGTVTFSGTSKDKSSTISSVKLYRTPNTEKGETGVDVVIHNVGTEKKEKLVALSGTDVTAEFSDSAAYAWAYSCTDAGVEREFVTTNLPADGEYTLYAVATDSAGNKGYAARKVNVDQDTDRPEIKISNFSLSGMGTSPENAKWHKYESFRGTVSDDDGIRYMKVSIDGGTTWSEDIYDGGSWAYDVSDGPHTLMFKIEDADGTTFTSSASAVADAPKITDGTTTLGLKTASAAAEKNTVLYAKVDTKTPDFTGMIYEVDGESKTALETIYYRTDNPLNASDELDTNVDGSGSKWKRGADLSGKEFGGPGSKLYILAAAKDANGIKEITAKLGDTTVVNGTEIWSDEKDGTDGNPKAVVIELDTSADTNLTGLTKLSVEAKDQADSTKKFEATINLDNAKPVLKVLSHSNGAQAFGSLETKVSGTTDKAEHVYFAVSKTESGTKTGWTEITGANYSSGLTWNIAFNGGAVYSNAYYTKVLNGYLRDAGYDMDGATKDDMKDLYLWFYAEDALGNSSDPVSLLLKVDPSGDRPIVDVTYPSKPDEDGNLATVGGIVRITGSTEVKAAGVTVQKVVLQIDPSYDEAAGFNEAGWKAELEALNGTKSVGYEIVKWENPEKGTESYGIVAAGSVSSWNLSINKAKELDTSNGNRKLAVRVYAMTAGKISEPVVIPFEIDANSPKIGSSKDLFLVQYDASGNVTAKRKYEENMWISGIWYLTGSVEDDSGISDITLDGTSILNTDKVVKDSSSSHTLSEEGNANTYYDYSLNIPVGDATEGAYGKKEYAIVATEGSNQGLHASVNIVVNYDNKAPVFAVSSMQSTGNEIKNTNYGYTMEGSFAETGNGTSNQSGFSRIAFYLTRTTGGNTYLIDPMLEKGAGGTANRENASGYETAQGLYWKEYSVSSVSGSKLTVTGTLSDSYRKGGLVMVKKVIYLITDVSGNDITVDGTLPDDLTASDKAYFTIAQVIDNTQQETGTKGSTLETSDNGLCSWEDGDGMIEGVILSGGTYSWNAEINSNNIWDGDVTVHFVAYDAAGNYATSDCAGTVVNNAPRLVGFRYGTDDNGNGKIQGKELRNDLSALNTDGEINKELEADGRTRIFPEYRGDSYGTKGTAEKPLFTIKGVTEVRPEVVGGNGNLKYSYNVTKSGDATASRTVAATAFADYTAQDADKYDQDYVEGVISIGLRDFLETDNEIKDGINNFQFSIEDSTETGAQSCSFGFWANVIIRDTEKPHGKIKPFFWTSREENSLYKNSTAQGHIELESDWEDSDGYTSATTGIGDKDPKVSGKIVMTGTAEDNTLLEGLWFYVKGFTFTDSPTSKTIDTLSYSKLASYDTTSGSWTCAKEESDFTADTPSNYFIEITDNTIDEDSGKHSVEWKLVIDTEKLGTVAAHDVVCRLAVTDRGELSLDEDDEPTYTPNTGSSTATVNTKAAAETMYYRMDVVPYITGVITNLSTSIKRATDASVYNRTAKGHYPVNGEKVNNNAVDSITLEGFNLGTTKTVDPTTLTSGKYTHTVGGVGSINNKNNNNAQGQAPATVRITDAVVDYDMLHTYAYNRKPNNSNNNTLTDDVEFDVWQFNSSAAQTYEGNTALREPVVRLNPTNGTLGYIFGSGSSRFSMPNKADNNGGTTYQLYQFNYATYVNMALCYDETGVAHGISTGIDTYVENGAQKAGRMSYFNSTWGPSSITSVAANFNGNNAVRFDCIGIPRNTTTAFGVTTGNDPILEEYRFYSPSIVATRRSENKANGDKQYQRKDGNNKDCTTVYFAYYDKLSNQIRFRAGDVTGNSFSPNNQTGQSFGQFYHNSNGEPAFVDNHYSVIAGYGSKQSTYNGGKYLCIDVIPGTSHDTDVVVAVWQDSVTDQLIFAYNDAPYAKVTYQWNTDRTNYGWKGLKKISDDSGFYCQIKADEDGNVHIACVNDSDEIEYTYIPKETSGTDIYANPVTVIVDSKESGVKKLSIDVEKKEGKVTPYITYFATKGKPKMAYFDGGLPGTKSTDTLKGADLLGFTGKWESGFLPTVSKIADDDSRNNTSVCASKVIPNTANFYVTGATNKAVGQTGNKTSNPIVGYAVTPNGTAGRIEIAQKK